MIIVLPTRTDYPFYSFEIELEQKTFEFEFHWNDRDQSWIFTIRDANGTDLLSGRKVVLGLPLLARYRDPRLPTGEITAIDTTDDDREPGLYELGDRVKLLHFEYADIPAAFKG